jgi:hypothetical protein
LLLLSSLIAVSREGEYGGWIDDSSVSGMCGLVAEWEIRFGPGNRFRVFYEVDREEGTVYILAIGVKERERLYIGGEEIEL